jgi:hypothetical protein
MTNTYSLMIGTNGTLPPGVQTPFVGASPLPLLIFFGSAIVVLTGAIAGILAARKRTPIRWLGLLRIMITVNVTATLVIFVRDVGFILQLYAITEQTPSKWDVLATVGNSTIGTIGCWLLLTSLNIVAIQLIQTIRRVKECQTADPGVNPSVGERM